MWAFVWTPLITSDAFTGIQADLGTAAVGIMAALIIILGIGILIRALCRSKTTKGGRLVEPTNMDLLWNAVALGDLATRVTAILVAFIGVGLLFTGFRYIRKSGIRA